MSSFKVCKSQVEHPYSLRGHGKGHRNYSIVFSALGCVNRAVLGTPTQDLLSGGTDAHSETWRAGRG